MRKLPGFIRLNKGFTLIELLIVIAIIGILSATLFIAINPAQRINQSKDAKAQDTIVSSAEALQAFYSDPGNTFGNGGYPTLAVYTGGSVADTNGVSFTKYLPSNGDGATVNTDGFIYFYKAQPNGCNGTSTPCAGYLMYAKMKTDNPTAWWVYDSTNGKACKHVSASAPAVGDGVTGGACAGE